MSTDAFDRYDAVRPMGAPTDIATKAAKEFRQRRFASRHPIVAFVLLPVVVLPLLWIGTIMAFVRCRGGRRMPLDNELAA